MALSITTEEHNGVFIVRIYRSLGLRLLGQPSATGIVWQLGTKWAYQLRIKQQRYPMQAGFADLATAERNAADFFESVWDKVA